MARNGSKTAKSVHRVMISVIILFSASESCLILAKLSSKQVNSPSFINALNISSWTFNVLTSTAKKMGGLKPPQPHPLGGPWTVNQACRGTLALKEALILQSSQIPLPNHVFYAFCNASNEGVNPRRKSWGSLRFFFLRFLRLSLSRDKLVCDSSPGVSFIFPRAFGNKNFARSVLPGTVEMVN